MWFYRARKIVPLSILFGIFFFAALRKCGFTGTVKPGFWEALAK
jgi:hypothetical protein